MTKENYTTMSNPELLNSIRSIHNFGNEDFQNFYDAVFLNYSKN